MRYRRSTLSELVALGCFSAASATAALSYVAIPLGPLGGARSGWWHAFLYRDGAMQDLGTLGGSYSTAFGINAHGQVAGYSAMAGNAPERAFLYSDGTMHDLNALVVSGLSGAVLTSALGVNDNGHVIANACFDIGSVRNCKAFRLDPAGPSDAVDVPTTSWWALLTMTLLALVAGLRHRHRPKA